MAEKRKVHRCHAQHKPLSLLKEIKITKEKPNYKLEKT